MLDIKQRLEEIERQNAKTKKKEEEDYTYSKNGCERQVKFNNKVKDIAIDQMRVELTKLLGVLPDKINDLIKKGEKELDDGNHVLKVADKFGFKAAEEFVKEELARNAEEEKKIKRFRKELSEKQSKMRSLRGFRGGYGGYRGGFGGVGGGFGSFGGGRQGFKGRQFSGAAKDGADKSKSSDVRCFNCQGFGHMARDCTKAHVPKPRK